MKKTCLICGKVFETAKGAKFCPDCRTQGKRICTQCGKVFVRAHTVSMCRACKNKRKKTSYARKKEQEEKRMQNPQSLDEKVAAARAAGLSYGQYSAMRRGLLRV